MNYKSIRIMNRPIILQLDNNSIYVNGSLKIPYENSNLPKQYFQLKDVIHLVVEQMSYTKETCTLWVKVIDYPPSKSVTGEPWGVGLLMKIS